MNFLKSVLSSSGGFPGYSLQDQVDVPAHCIFTLHNATVRESGTSCSVFTFDISREPRLLPLARNYQLKLRSLKHPGVVKFLDALETNTHIYIATERVSPLLYTLARTDSPDVICWGLYDVASTISFLNSEAASIHGNIRSSSIFTTEAGEWKIAGFEVMSSMKEEDPFIVHHGSLVPDIYQITPTEVQSKGFTELKHLNLTSLDSWQFAGLLWSCFNGTYSSNSSLSSQGKIPNSMFSQYRRLLSPQAASRLSVANFLAFGRRPGSFFMSDLIEVSKAIPSLPLKSKAEVEEFLSSNMKVIAALPAGFTKNKLLPELIRSFEFGGGGSTAFAAILLVAKDLAPSDIEVLVVPVILRFWSSKDRGIHLVLLEQLKDYIEYLSSKQINDKLFTAVGSVFFDPAPILRETAIRQVMILMPHLSDRTINGDLLKCLAKSANDQQPGIRTNTTICLGKIAPHLGLNNRRKVLTAAFSRSLKDPFIHARMAALQAISATYEVYDKEDLATRLMVGVVNLLIDTERPVRAQAKKTLSVLLTRIEELTKDMPDAIISRDSPSETSSHAATSATDPTTSAIESAGIWTGWAISTMSRNLDLPSSSSSTSLPLKNSSTASLPTTRSATPTINQTVEASSHQTQDSKSKPSIIRASSGLKLASKPKKVDVSAIYAESFGTSGDPWGTDSWDDQSSLGTKPKSTSPEAFSGLAKPLAKSTLTKGTSKIVKTNQVMPKKASDDGEDWDTDAW